MQKQEEAIFTISKFKAEFSISYSWHRQESTAQSRGSQTYEKVKRNVQPFIVSSFFLINVFKARSLSIPPSSGFVLKNSSLVSVFL